MQDANEIIVRLAKLSETIEKKESEMANIRKLGTIKAGVSSDYVYNLRAEHLSCQREYNLILDQNPSLTEGCTKIIIDTFKDRWLEERTYKILEHVEVDIESRLQETSWFYRNAKIGENAQYEIFLISGSFLRRDKDNSFIVYLGEGNAAAALFGQWIYWYEFGSIISDKYIYRRSIDGRQFEKLDWLSNEKTMEVLGESAHYVSEDSVKKMSSDSNTLVIEVLRKTKNQTYNITVTNVGGNLCVSKAFPWIEEAEDKLDENPHNTDTTNNNAKSFLSSNPFFILAASPTDKRHTIISKAEEKSFLLEGGECEDAQAKLLNPEKRLAAELDWFCGISIERLADIYNCINTKKAIVTDDLSGIACLNAMLYNFSISSYDDYFDLGYAILELDELYSNLDVGELLYTINSCRQQAGFRDISENELTRDFNRKREQIRQLIARKVDGLSEDDYIDFASTLAEKYIANDDYDDGIILSDVIDQYELKMQHIIDTSSEEIIAHIDRIKKIANDEGINSSLTGLISRVKKWDRLVQPLQARSLASGMPHKPSERVGFEIRRLALYLHNDRDMTQSALSLVVAMKDVFAEIGNVAIAFSEDEKALNKIISEEKALKNIINGIKGLEKTLSKWKEPDTNTNPYALSSNAITQSTVSSYIEQVRALNSQIEDCGADDEIVIKLRENLCYTAREAAIYLHNERHKTDLALYIAKELVEIFGDDEILYRKLSDDVDTLNKQMLALNSVLSQPVYSASQRTSKSSSGNLGCLAVIGIVLVICLIIGGFSQCGSSGNSEPYVFSQSAKSGDDVYVNIVSIEPVYSISTQGSYTTTDVACRCKTSDGKTVWVYMSVYEYNKYIDPNAKLSNSFNADYETVRYSPAKKISGEARKAESLCDGLSTKTATMILYFDSIK